jgi:hypothetical protein
MNLYEKWDEFKRAVLVIKKISNKDFFQIKKELKEFIF